MIILLIAVFAIIVLIDLPRLIKKKMYRMLVVYGLVYTAAFTLCLLIILDIKVISPIVLANDFLKNVLHLSY